MPFTCQMALDFETLFIFYSKNDQNDLVTNHGSNNCDQINELDYQGKENYLRKTIQ
jgi:hypothetical protein